MEFQNLVFEISEGVATITLNRPKLHNVLDRRLWMHSELSAR